MQLSQYDPEVEFINELISLEKLQNKTYIETYNAVQNDLQMMISYTAVNQLDN